MVTKRGNYSTGSKTKLSLIEAASELLAKEGYEAITARRIAARAKVKPQLVHYYFRSMEELVVTVFRRSAAVYYQIHDEALSSPNPLRALWDLNSNQPEAQRMFEYIALSKKHPALRDEMRQTGENFRKLQVEAIRRAYAQRGIDDPRISPEALAMLMSAIARNLVIESQVEMSDSHAEMVSLVEHALTHFDPGQTPAAKRDA